MQAVSHHVYIHSSYIDVRAFFLHTNVEGNNRAQEKEEEGSDQYTSLRRHQWHVRNAPNPWDVIWRYDYAVHVSCMYVSMHTCIYIYV